MCLYFSEHKVYCKTKIGANGRMDFFITAPILYNFLNTLQPNNIVHIDQTEGICVPVQSPPLCYDVKTNGEDTHGRKRRSPSSNSKPTKCELSQTTINGILFLIFMLVEDAIRNTINPPSNGLTTLSQKAINRLEYDNLFRVKNSVVVERGRGGGGRGRATTGVRIDIERGFVRGGIA